MFPVKSCPASEAILYTTNRNPAKINKNKEDVIRWERIFIAFMIKCFKEFVVSQNQ